MSEQPPGGEANENPDRGPDSGPETPLSTAGKPASDIDQAVSDFDQSASEMDQSASDADQAASDIDQAASDADQATSEGEGPDAMSPGDSAGMRRSSARKRKAATIARGRTSGYRDREAKKVAAQDRRYHSTLELLRRALDGDDFVVFAQPIVDLATDLISQYELLIRMRDEDGGILAPDDFIPIAERFGLVPDVDRWMTRCGAGLAARGHIVHVNLSGATLDDPGFGDDVETYLRGAFAPGKNLVFELTETALISNEPLAVRFLERVRVLGCGVAIDDFGSGYGSLHYIKRFAVDFLKIDREFVTDLAVDRSSEMVVDAIVRLASDFEVRTVAEGVEDAAALEQLRALGITHAQGYFLGRPAPVSEVIVGAKATHTSA